MSNAWFDQRLPPHTVTPCVGMLVRQLGILDYETSYHAMRGWIDQHAHVQSGASAPGMAYPLHAALDELWVVQHPAVYTAGLAARPAHFPLPHTPGAALPLIKTDRGGQITHHGLGQVVIYVLLNLKRYHLKVRELVVLLEQVLIDVVYEYGITAERHAGAPGVYVGAAKIAALGLRIRQGWSYHGLALNVDMDLTPFDWIDPCGYQGLAVTQMADLVQGHVSVAEVSDRLLACLTRHLTSTADRLTDDMTMVLSRA